MMTVLQLKKEKSLDDLVTEIRYLMIDIASAEERVFKKRLKAGFRLLELREPVGTGEAGDVSWWSYYDKHLSTYRSRKDAEKLLKIAAANKPEEAAEAAAQRNREHQTKHRAKHDAAYVSGKPTDEGKKPKPMPVPIPRELLALRNEVAKELEARGEVGVRAIVHSAEHSKAMGGPAEPTLGYFCEPCQADTAKKAVDEAVDAVLARRALAEPEQDTDDYEVLFRNMVDAVTALCVAWPPNLTAEQASEYLDDLSEARESLDTIEAELTEI